MSEGVCSRSGWWLSCTGGLVSLAYASESSPSRATKASVMAASVLKPAM